MSKIILGKWCKKLGFCFNRCDKKLPVYLQFDVVIVPLVCKFIKSETLAELFSCEFYDFFLAAALLETKLRHRCFPVNFTKC